MFRDGYWRYDHATFRSYQQMEGYTMCKDGYVTSVETVPYTNTEYVAVKSLVKPRTNDKDPVTRKSHYSCWISMKNSSEASIQLAYCTCKGGVDGSCRHVVATLFEVLDFVDDYKKSSCTSVPCVWVRRASQLQQLGQPVTAVDLDTSVTSEQSAQTPMPLYCPLSTDYQTPDRCVFQSTSTASSICLCPTCCI